MGFCFLPKVQTTIEGTKLVKGKIVSIIFLFAHPSIFRRISKFNKNFPKEINGNSSFKIFMSVRQIDENNSLSILKVLLLNAI